MPYYCYQLLLSRVKFSCTSDVARRVATSETYLHPKVFARNGIGKKIAWFELLRQLWPEQAISVFSRIRLLAGKGSLRGLTGRKLCLFFGALRN